MTRSAPPAAAETTSEPPMWANFTSPVRSAGIPLELSMSVSSTSRPCFAKMPASFATQSGRLLAMTLLYEAPTLTGAGAALAAEGGAGVDAPPHALMRRLATNPTERARCIFTPFAGRRRSRTTLARRGGRLPGAVRLRRPVAPQALGIGRALVACDAQEQEIVQVPVRDVARVHEALVRAFARGGVGVRVRDPGDRALVELRVHRTLRELQGPANLERKVTAADHGEPARVVELVQRRAEREAHRVEARGRRERRSDAVAHERHDREVERGPRGQQREDERISDLG